MCDTKCRSCDLSNNLITVSLKFSRIRIQWVYIKSERYNKRKSELCCSSTSDNEVPLK